MCMVSEEATLSKTKIFVAPSKDKKRQIVIYSNNVSTRTTTNMMILPVPTPRSVKFIDLSNYKDVFKDLEQDFTGYLLSANSRSFGQSKSLEVFHVGSYDCSILQTMTDFDNLDPNYFKKPDQTLLNILKEHYKSFGFIICKLKSGDHNYHPIAYTHDIVGGKVLVPTRHYHPNGSIFNSSMFGKNPNDEDDWDHDIYVWNCKKFSEATECIKYALKENSKIPFETGPITNKCKYTIKGTFTNSDLMIPVIV